MYKEWLKHLARLYLPIYLYKSETTKIIYAGYSSIKKKTYVRLLLDGNYHQTFIGRRWFWKIPDLIKSFNPDMVISEISMITLNYFQRSFGYILPGSASMRINIDRPMGEIMKRNITDFHNVQRLIRKYKLTYEILTDKENLKYFNESFYLPYITKQHGDEAMIDDLNILWKSSPSPSLIAIRENGIMVAASLVSKSGDFLYLKRLGVLDGNQEYRHHGVIGAIYYFGILEGKKMGCRYIDVGGTKPFLADRLTRSKMGMGAEFVSDHSSLKEYLWLGVNEQSSFATSFILCNPFMHLNKDHKLVKSGK